MKRITAYFLAICSLVVFVFAGCENSQNVLPQDPTLLISDTDPSDQSDPESEPSSSENSSDSSTGVESGDSDVPVEEPPKKKDEPKYVEFFREKAVHTLSIEIKSADWEAICEDPLKKDYHPADITIDGKTISQCGFKTHGNSTLQAAIDREVTLFPFKIKFDKYTDEKFLGLDELVLCNNILDNSYARQYAGYEAFHAIGKDAPYCTFFSVYINGERFGLYAGVEDVDSSYLKRVFGNKKNNLYKMNNSATLMSNMPSWAVSQKKGEDTSKSDLKLLVKTLKEMPLGEKGNIEEILDVDSALAYLAVGAVIHHCDGYAGYSANNYCLYFDGNVFHMIPWDMDLCFYQTGWGFLPSKGSRMDIKDGLTDTATLSERPLVQKLLAVDEYYATYLEYCKQTAKWLGEFSESGVDELYSLLDETVKKDPKNNYYVFKGEYNSSELKSFAGYIKDRAAYLEKRIPEIYQEKGIDY